MANGARELVLEDKTPLKCLEFFAGIGGFHYAIRESVPGSEILAAFDINTVTNAIYKHNFPETKIFQRNIQALSCKFLDSMKADLWTMSPPCQPFTKKGCCRDLEDRRCDALKQICSNLRDMQSPPRYIMVENVYGFESSSAHDLLLDTLRDTGYFTEEFLLSPVQLGIPNSRPRYYLLARRDPFPSSSQVLRNDFPESCNFRQRLVGDFLNKEDDDCSVLAVNWDSILNYGPGINFVAKPSKCSACFTKSYSLYLSGCGSIVVSSPELQVENPKDEILEIISALKYGDSTAERTNGLKLRYFSWREMANLLGFPIDFQKPSDTTNKQMYRALGNSISVFAVAQLLRYLMQ